MIKDASEPTSPKSAAPDDRKGGNDPAGKSSPGSGAWGDKPGRSHAAGAGTVGVTAVRIPPFARTDNIHPTDRLPPAFDLTGDSLPLDSTKGFTGNSTATAGVTADGATLKKRADPLKPPFKTSAA
jgi:hypothetical protein